jgi:GTP-binding protein HflX
LETDRRLIAKRIRTLKSRLEKLARQRDTSRHVRREVPVPTVALVGYTNAGKSTLFNALTDSSTYVADQLFATLDPTVRRVKLAGVGEVVLADTVGFVRALPHELVAAFRSTLQEARDADLLLHVVDASDPLRDERIEQVREVLRSIGAGEIPELVVFNKIDLLAEEPRVVLGADRMDGAGMDGAATGRAGMDGPGMGRPGLATLVSVSAATGAGLPGLREALAQAVRSNQVRRTLHLELLAAAIRSDLYKRNAVRSERQCDDGSWDLDVELDLSEVDKLLGSKGVNLVDGGAQAREQRVA